MPFAIRRATPDDAEPLIAYLRRLLAEPGINLVAAPEEFGLTAEQERKFISDMNTSENSVLLIAVSNGQIIGDISVRGESRRAKAHTGVIGISVAAGWRGQGIGSALMQAAINWAQASGIITRLELLVFARNESAIHLYQKFGFEIEGRKRCAINKYGEFHDEYIMARLLD